MGRVCPTMSIKSIAVNANNWRTRVVFHVPPTSAYCRHLRTCLPECRQICACINKWPVYGLTRGMWMRETFSAHIVEREPALVVRSPINRCRLISSVRQDSILFPIFFRATWIEPHVRDLSVAQTENTMRQLFAKARKKCETKVD